MHLPARGALIDIKQSTTANAERTARRDGSHCEGDTTILPVLVGEGQASAYRYLRPHNSLAAVEVVLLLVHMHGAAHALGSPIHSPHQLCHDLHNRPPSSQMGAVISVGGNDGVSVLQSCLDALQDGLLPIVSA